MKIFGWIIATPFILLIVWGIGRLLFCGPDKNIKKVTNPLADSMLAYVNKNGKPKSLSEIKTLPYKMQECKRSEKVRNSATEFIEKESCVFTLNKKRYTVVIDYYTKTYKDKNVDGIILKVYDYKKNTEIYYYFDQKKFKKELKLLDFGFRSIRTPFLCRAGYLKVG